MLTRPMDVQPTQWLCGMVRLHVKSVVLHTFPMKSNLHPSMTQGMGDTCCNPQSMGYIKKLIEEQIPGIYVYR